LKSATGLTDGREKKKGKKRGEKGGGKTIMFPMSRAVEAKFGAEKKKKRGGGKGEGRSEPHVGRQRSGRSGRRPQKRGEGKKKKKREEEKDELTSRLIPACFFVCEKEEKERGGEGKNSFTLPWRKTALRGKKKKKRKGKLR